MSFSTKIRVGVLRGGPSLEYDISLDTGKTILSNLPEEYLPLDIFISKDGLWHTGGLEKSPYNILKSVDVVVNAMHGAYGEDGKVQKLLENFCIPYSGSDSVASALSMNKAMAKDIFRQAGLKTPLHLVVTKDDKEIAGKINENLLFPIIIKPVNLGSSMGISYVENRSQIEKALAQSFKYADRLLVEEYIDGKEATCGVVEGFRGKDIYTLLPVEVMKGKNKYFHDYDAKYAPPSADLDVRYRVPGSFKTDEKVQIEKMAALVHKILGLRHYSRSDFILHPKRGLFVLEVNSLPELAHRSSFIKSLEAAGSNIREFLSHLISRTLGKK